jgi:hypothetical protein
LTRNRPSSVPLLQTTTGGVTTPLLNASQLDLSTGWGYELDMIRRFNRSCNAAEVRYFGVYGFNSSFGPTAAQSVAFVQIPNPFDPAVASANYTSQLQSAEANLRRQYTPWLQLLAGFRWVELDDVLSESVTVTAGRFQGTQSIQRLNAFNRLFGAQIGADAQVWQRGRLAVDAIGKAGIYGNTTNSYRTSTFISPIFGTNTTGLARTAEAGKTAFVGEIGLTGRYMLTERLWLRSTYELLWIDGVATASDQVPNLLSGASPVPGAKTSSNTVFYNGAFIGVEYRN